MPAITIRNVPEHVRDELAARAKRRGQSLQEYLLAQLEEIATSITPDDVFGRARERAHATGTDVSAQDITAIIRDIRGD